MEFLISYEMRILIFSFAIGMSLPSMTAGAITEGALINGLWGPMPEWKRFTPAAFLEVPEEPTKDSIRNTEGQQSDGTLYKTKRGGLATYLYRKASNQNRLGYDPGKIKSTRKVYHQSFADTHISTHWDYAK